MNSDASTPAEVTSGIAVQTTAANDAPVVEVIDPAADAAALADIPKAARTLLGRGSRGR
jgi:hypothetical protein